jgi:adenylate kinase family enzyme
MSTKAFVALRRRGIAFTVLGPDGAGKSTVVRSLTAGLPLPVVSLYLGLYQRGSDGRTITTARRFARLARARALTTWHVRRGRIVLFDRHPVELSVGRRGTRAGLRRATFMALAPRLDHGAVLDAPGALLHERSGEHSPDELERRRADCRDIAASRGFAVVDATQPEDSVAAAVLTEVLRTCGEVWGR